MLKANKSTTLFCCSYLFDLIVFLDVFKLTVITQVIYCTINMILFIENSS